MALATALSQIFNMPVSKVTGTGRGRQQAQQEAQGSVLGAPPTGLQNVDNVTRDFYQKWADLENFASEMKIKYGIDVTKPDFSSQEAMEAHEMFQKGAADLHYQTNKLTQAQKDLTLANKAMAGTQGHRFSINGDPTQQVYDPSMLQMAPPDESTAGQVTARDRWLEQKRLERENRAAKRAQEKSDIKTEKDKEDFQVYRDIAQTLGKIGTKELPWTVAEDGSMSSDVLSGSKYGTTSNAGIIRNITYDPDTEEVRIHYGEEDDEKSIEVNPETQEEVYRNLILGQTKLKPDVASRYIRSISEEGMNIFDLVPEEARGSFEKATQEREQLLAGKKQEIVDNILSSLNNYNSDSRKLMNENLSGKTVKVKNDAGEYEDKVINKIEKSNLGGEYKITFEDGESARFGGGKGENNYIIEDFLLSQSQEPVAAQAEEEIPPETIFVVGDEEYTFQQLLEAGNSKEDILKEAKRK